MTIDLSGGDDPAGWAPLPTSDRAMVGGVTVWLGGHSEPLLVCQPNRWGVIEQGFPDVPCVVEADPDVSRWLPLPSRIVGWVDRCHARIEPPRRQERGRLLMHRAERLGAKLTQIRGVSVARRPFGRTIPLITPLEPTLLVAAAVAAGVEGLHPIPGLGGGVTLAVSHEHDDQDLAVVAAVIEAAVTATQ